MKPKLLIVVNVDWFFLSHRLPQALAAKVAGYDVTVAAADTGHGVLIRNAGLRFIPLPISRKGTALFGELRTVIALARLYRTLQPDLVHHVSIKPILYGSIVARLCRVPAVINAVSGLGYMFYEGRSAAATRAIRALYHAAFRHPRSVTIFQNDDDQRVFLDARLILEQNTRIIRGSGVDCDRFKPEPEPAGPPVVILPARMLWDKGVEYFVEAARILKNKNVQARFVLVGGSDSGNPSAIPVDQLAAWVAEGHVEWLGDQADMPTVFANAHIVALPSRREGLPKALLEAAACARPMVASNVPGCREIVQDHITGLLVPFGDANALADALETLIGQPEVRRRLGCNARALVVSRFEQSRIVSQILDVYSEQLNAARAS